MREVKINVNFIDPADVRMTAIAFGITTDDFLIGLIKAERYRLTSGNKQEELSELRLQKRDNGDVVFVATYKYDNVLRMQEIPIASTEEKENGTPSC